MSRQPLLIALVFYLLGIVVIDVFVIDFRYIVILLCVALLLCVSSFFIPVKSSFFKHLSVLFFVFVLGVFSHFINKNRGLNDELQPQEKYVFWISKKLNANENSKRYEVEVIGKNTKGKTQALKSIISIPKENPDLDFEHYYKASIYSKKLQSPVYDFQFNYAKYLARQSIYHQAWIKGTIEKSDKKMSISDQIKQWRFDVLRKITNSQLSSRSKEFTKGIILADRTGLDAEVITDFSKTGLVHFLAISGTHMLVIFWLVSFLLKKIFIGKRKNIAVVLALVFIWGFTIFIDYGSSVVRSSTMLTIYYSSILFNRKPDLLHSLALAAFILLIFDTQSLFDVGFQLSFLAVLGIFWLNKPILNLFSKPKNDFVKFFLSVFSVSLSAQLATFPLVILYFHQYSYLSIVANILIVPFSEIIIIFSLLMTVLLGFGAEFYWLNALYDGAIKILLQVIHFFSTLDGAYFENIPMSWVEVILLFVLLYFLRGILLHRNTQNMLWFSGVFLSFLLLRFSLNFYFQQKKETLLVENGKKKVLIVKRNQHAFFYIPENSDSTRVKKYIVQPYLSDRRIQQFSLKYIPEKSSKVLIYGKIYILK